MTYRFHALAENLSAESWIENVETTSGAAAAVVVVYTDGSENQVDALAKFARECVIVGEIAIG